MSTTAMEVKQELVTPMTLIERGAAAGASLEQMAQLLDLQLRYEANEAQKSFHAAFTAFKAESISIIRDKENSQYSKGEKKAMYTSLENMVATVTPFLSKHGLSHRWELEQGQSIKVTCVITHVLGHSVSVSMSGPPDDSGAKNKLQQIKSSVTYLKVGTFEAACGLASAFGNVDDDGNGAAAPPSGMVSTELERYLGLIAEADTLAHLQQLYEAAYADANELNDWKSVKAIVKARDARKKEIS